MKLNRDKRNYLIIGLCAILLIMVVGYAAFASQLTINSSAEVTSTWDVHIKNDPTTEAVNLATSTKSLKTSALTAEFECELTTPGTSTITYVVPVINEGSLNAKLTRINVTGGTSAISVVSNPTNASLTGTPVILNANGGETTVKIVVSYNDVNTPPTGSDATANITVTLDFVQTNESASNTTKVYAINTNAVTIGSSTLANVGTTYASCAATGKNVCLRHTIEDNTVTGSEVCFVKDSTEYCITGGDSGAAYVTNQDTLNTAFPGVCSGTSTFLCNSGVWHANAYSTGNVYVYEYASESHDGDYWSCFVYSRGGYSRCELYSGGGSGE